MVAWEEGPGGVMVESIWSKLLAYLMAAVLLLCAGSRLTSCYYLLEPAEPGGTPLPLDEETIALGCILVLAALTTSLQALMLAFIPRWSARYQYTVLVPLLILVTVLCYFGDWHYVAFNVLQGILSLGASEYIRHRHVLQRLPKYHV